MSSLAELRASLPIRGLGEPFFHFDAVGSTNDVALEEARKGAVHGALFVTDHQTAGRGRAGRIWLSTANSALTFSLVLRPNVDPMQGTAGLAGLGALAVVKALEKWSVPAAIKWPNDVLIDRRKAAGILVETSWMGDVLEYAVMGIGINIQAESVPVQDVIDYPATCVESAAGKPVDRYDFLLDVLDSLGCWIERIGSKEVFEAWQKDLAYVNEEVVVQSTAKEWVGVLTGITMDGRLRLETSEGEQILAAAGDVRMRSVDTSAKSATLGS
jgi:BirA family biotin operon repressor/biotin-[acetyl-CoA-carboxylase] ligase